jgi:hypothetical protein
MLGIGIGTGIGIGNGIDIDIGMFGFLVFFKAFDLRKLAILRTSMVRYSVALRYLNEDFSRPKLANVALGCADPRVPSK